MKFKNWLFENEEKILRIKFSDVKFDTIDKYYVDLDKAANNISNISKVNIGDKIADLVISNAFYWQVIDKDEDKNRIYLEPIGKNPYVPNSEGQVVGAGGKVFDQHDFDVLAGDYERKRIDSMLDQIQKKEYHDIRDISYILLGTVPVQVGPNGAQGGWYAVGHTTSNRGGRKGMNAVEIMMKDADTLKNKLGFSVPAKALDGTLNPSTWNDFVGGQSLYSRNFEDTKLEEEDFNDVEKMASIILSHAQPAIRKRNGELLLRLCRGNDTYDNIVRNISFQLAKQSKVTENLDYLWHIKEDFINFAKNKGWDDVLEAFADSHDPVNRKYVASGLSELSKVGPVLKMLDKETHRETIKGILSSLYSFISKVYEQEPEMQYLFDLELQFGRLFERDPEIKEKLKAIALPILKCIENNKNKIENILKDDEDSYHNADIKVYMNRFKKLEKILFS